MSSSKITQKNIKIRLKDLCGEFCTRREQPGMLELKQQIAAALKNGTQIILEREGIKLLGASFVDELMPSFIISHGKETIDRLIVFEPSLEDIYIEYIDSGIKRRS